jgi:hypothetical protein
MIFSRKSISEWIEPNCDYRILKNEETNDPDRGGDLATMPKDSKAE